MIVGTSPQLPMGVLLFSILFVKCAHLYLIVMLLPLLLAFVLLQIQETLSLGQPKLRVLFLSCIVITYSGFINAAGIQSPGLTSAPAIAEVLVNILGKEGLDLFNKDHWIPVGASSPKFFNLTPEEQDKKSKDNHLFAKVIT